MASSSTPLLSGQQQPASSSAPQIFTWSAPPPEHSPTAIEASYRFGASLSWKLGCFFGFLSVPLAAFGYLVRACACVNERSTACLLIKFLFSQNPKTPQHKHTQHKTHTRAHHVLQQLPDPRKPAEIQVYFAFFAAIITLLAHSLLLLAISLRLGAYRSLNRHHTHPNLLFSNPVSKMRINAPAFFVTLGILGFSGGVAAAVLTGDSLLGGFWPFIPAGAAASVVGWFCMFFI
ncbi:hypothetical protein DFJ73DRAFT_815449 [Zopfochytrium polystomum]|nr:hypothetical protein DFJ73DRAFT_815449 [Zopfochytrium polystomum]